MSSPLPYVHRYHVGFADTDAAQIVYTGRFPQFALDAIEGWFRDRLGTHWFELNTVLGIGTPFVHLSIDMVSSLTPMDILLSTVRLARTGRSSLEFAVTGHTERENRLSYRGRFVCVFVDPAQTRSMPIPDRFRDAVSAELALGAAPPD